MIKKISAVVLAMIMMFSFAACKGESGNKTVDLMAIKADILKQTNTTDNIELTAESFGYEFGIEADKVKTNASYMLLRDIFPDKIVMVEAVDEEAAKYITEKLETHLASLKEQADGYDAKGQAIAEATTVIVKGNYIAMFYTQDREQIEEIYNSYF